MRAGRITKYANAIPPAKSTVARATKRATTRWFRSCTAGAKKLHACQTSTGKASASEA